jgi:pullulanase
MQTVAPLQPGLTYSPAASSFCVWSPDAEKMNLLFYRKGVGDEPFDAFPLALQENGYWMVTIPGDHAGVYYALQARFHGGWKKPVPDPYAKAVGINGYRAQVINIAATNPAGWENDRAENLPPFLYPTDAVLYETHIRDFSMHAHSGMQHKGKYLSLTETNTRNKAGDTTGLSYLKTLGITHLHLLPCNDMGSVDETAPSYNWGYDPLHYFALEGSYATNPHDPANRIKEFKRMIQALHLQGIRVVMDVVFNHTYFTEKSLFEQLAPGQYYRFEADGRFADGSSCGNEIASEKPLVRQFITDCLLYWMHEFHIDGFRFDLMGLLDLDTMNELSEKLHAVRPDLLLYGEGWAGGTTPYPAEKRAVKENLDKLNQIAVFSDDIRDALKGKVFHPEEKGFISGGMGFDEIIRAAVVASCPHPQIQYEKVNYRQKPFARQPWQVVNYADCHDNHTLWDRLLLSCAANTEAERKKMVQLALSIVLTAQGVPFLHAGTEFLRSKQGIENSYKSNDSINAIHWDQRSEHADLVDYIRQLIQIRQTHPAFRLRTTQQLQQVVQFDEQAPAGSVVYQLNGSLVNDSWKRIWIAYNGNAAPVTHQLPTGNWQTAIQSDPDTVLLDHLIRIEAFSTVILYEV